jgi:ketopantoate reductase
MRNKNEDNLISAVDRMAIYEQLEPVIRAAMKYGGGADTILAKAQSLAAAEIIGLLRSDKEEVRLNAAKELLNRSLGKPVERKISLHSDISQMNQAEIDRSIKQLLKTASPAQVVDAAVAALPAAVKAKAKIKQSPKPGKPDLG